MEPDVTSPRRIARAGDYDLIRRMGSGGFGVVFEARHRQTGLLYAVKRIRAQRRGRRTLPQRGALPRPYRQRLGPRPRRPFVLPRSRRRRLLPRHRADPARRSAHVPHPAAETAAVAAGDAGRRRDRQGPGGDPCAGHRASRPQAGQRPDGSQGRSVGAQDRRLRARPLDAERVARRVRLERVRRPGAARSALRHSTRPGSRPLLVRNGALRIADRRAGVACQGPPRVRALARGAAPAALAERGAARAGAVAGSRAPGRVAAGLRSRTADHHRARLRAGAAERIADRGPHGRAAGDAAAAAVRAAACADAAARAAPDGPDIAIQGAVRRRHPRRGHRRGAGRERRGLVGLPSIQRVGRRPPRPGGLRPRPLPGRLPAPADGLRCRRREVGSVPRPDVPERRGRDPELPRRPPLVRSRRGQERPDRARRTRLDGAAWVRGAEGRSGGPPRAETRRRQRRSDRLGVAGVGLRERCRGRPRCARGPSPLSAGGQRRQPGGSIRRRPVLPRRVGRRRQIARGGDRVVHAGRHHRVSRIAVRARGCAPRSLSRGASGGQPAADAIGAGGAPDRPGVGPLVPDGCGRRARVWGGQRRLYVLVRLRRARQLRRRREVE